MNTRAAALLLTFTFAVPLLRAHEAPGRGGHKEAAPALATDFESYFGRHGYYHFGLGVQMPIGARQQAGLITHLARENSGGEPIPSLGAEYGLRLDGGVELEAFSFGYFPTLQQHAWAIGLRATKEFELSEHVTLAPFFGPTFARVRAIEEATERPADVSHTMLFGGVLIERDPVELMIFGSHSFFSRDAEGLESHVDLEEMTHFAVYENNDGLARNSAGADVRWEMLEKLSLSARYAAIFFEGESTRHSVMISPRWKITERFDFFFGAQFLRGGPGDNDIGFAGVSLRF